MWSLDWIRSGNCFSFLQLYGRILTSEGVLCAGEASTTQARADGDVMNDFVSAPKRILQRFIEHAFPTTVDQSAHEINVLLCQVCFIIACTLGLEPEGADHLPRALESVLLPRPSAVYFILVDVSSGIWGSPASVYTWEGCVISL